MFPLCIAAPPQAPLKRYVSGPCAQTLYLAYWRSGNAAPSFRVAGREVDRWEALTICRTTTGQHFQQYLMSTAKNQLNSNRRRFSVNVHALPQADCFHAVIHRLKQKGGIRLIKANGRTDFKDTIVGPSEPISTRRCRIALTISPTHSVAGVPSSWQTSMPKNSPSPRTSTCKGVWAAMPAHQASRRIEPHGWADFPPPSLPTPLCQRRRKPSIHQS